MWMPPARGGDQARNGGDAGLQHLAQHEASMQRSNVFLTYDGETRIAAEWARITGLNVATIRQRKKRGWTDTQILTTPPDVRFQSR